MELFSEINVGDRAPCAMFSRAGIKEKLQGIKVSSQDYLFARGCSS
jgi:hypothetical protein